MSWPIFSWAVLQILMNVLPWWVYVAMDVAWISLEGSAVTVSQATLLLLTRLDAEVRNVWITCDWSVLHVSMHVLEMFTLSRISPSHIKSMLGAFVWPSVQKVGIKDWKIDNTTVLEIVKVFYPKQTEQNHHLLFWFLISWCNSVIIKLVFTILIEFKTLCTQFIFSIDIDECTEVPGFCENGICTNTIGGSRCECTTGYKLNVAGDACVGEKLDTRNEKL